MTYSPVIYDWRYECSPIDQVFVAGGSSISGGVTIGGASVSMPEPGGRGELQMTFAPFATPEANLSASWTVSRIRNGNVMRIRLYNSVQLVDSDMLGGAYDNGIPWGNDLPWFNGENWAWNPSAPLATGSPIGSEVVQVNLSSVGPVLAIGHVIGFSKGGYEFAHVVIDIDYVGNTANVSLSPPIRRTLAEGDLMLFRPAMLVTCMNASEVVGTFSSGRHMTFGAARFVEALV